MRYANIRELLFGPKANKLCFTVVNHKSIMNHPNSNVSDTIFHGSNSLRLYNYKKSIEPFTLANVGKTVSKNTH